VPNIEYHPLLKDYEDVFREIPGFSLKICRFIHQFDALRCSIVQDALWDEYTIAKRVVYAA
jgi:hypothetical protein